jgi:hypothetical protein
MAGVKLADATAYLKVDDTELTKGMSSAEKTVESSGNKFGSVLQGVGMSVGMGIAGIASSAASQVVGFMSDSIGSASDLGETISKTGVVFGDSSAAIMEWSETSAQALGQSKADALGAAATFGNLFVSMGMANDTSADMSMNLVELASDLASFNNMDPAEALDKLKAGLLGSAEPMQSLGVNMNAAMVTQKALEMGLAATADALTPAMQAQARYAIILEQTTTAQGDFARTSDGLANQQRIADAQWADLSATVGETLLPVMTALISTTNDIVQKVLPPLTAFIKDQVVPVMNAMAEAIGGAVKLAQEWFGKLKGAVNTDAVAPLNFFKGWLDTNMPRIQQIVKTVLDAIAGFWRAHGEKIMAGLSTFLAWVSDFWNVQFRTILNIVQVILQLLTGDFEGAGETLENILNDWKSFFERIIKAITSGIRTWFNEVDWGGIGKGILNGIAAGIRNGAGAIANAARDAANRALDAAKNLLGIHSPSKVAAEEIGEPFAEGIGAGIRASLADMASGVNLGLNSLMGGVGGQQMATAGAPISITINVGGGGDTVGTGMAARDGVLSALRSVGLR